MTIEFFNYGERFQSVPDLLPDLIESHSASGQFILKESVAAFEQSVADFLMERNTNTNPVYCACISSASMGMVIALKALGIGPGDEVITPAYSYVSTASAIVSAGATPVFVDVDPETFMISTETVKTKITARTKAVIAVHLYKHLMDVAALKSALPKSVAVVEDSATCMGGQLNGVPAGLMGDIGVYSFFPAKPLGGLGDAGMLVTQNPMLHRLCAMYRNHGQDGQVRFTHFVLGYNSRMDDINAAFLRQKLPMLEEHNRRRNVIAQQYDDIIDDLGWCRQQSNIGHTNIKEVPYSYILLSNKPKALVDHLYQNGVQARRGFPLALPDQPAFADWHDGVSDFMNTRNIVQSAVALPIYPELEDEQVLVVQEALTSFVETHHD